MRLFVKRCLYVRGVLMTVAIVHRVDFRHV